MKNIKFILIMFSLIASSLMAGDAGQESPFSIGASARALGMGGGFTSIADDASAVYYNPAGLPNLNYQEISFMHIELFEGTSYNYASWVFQDSKLGGVGISMYRIGTDGIQGTSNFVSSRTFDYSQSQILFSYGKSLSRNVSFGSSFKIVNQSLDSLSGYGLGLDFGLLANFSNHISGGLILRDILPPEIELANTIETTPITIAGGFGIKDVSLTENSLLNTVIEIEKVERREVKLHLGSELILNNAYAIRSGYDRDNLSFGAGLMLNRIKIDYAYKVLDNINDSHRFSVAFLIGTSLKDKILSEEKLVESRGTVLLEEERLKQFEFFKNKADVFHDIFKLDSALAYYQRALAFDDHNEEIIGVIAAIENSITVQQKTEQDHAGYHQDVEATRITYLAQAQNFYEKKYYNAALDMILLIFDISPNYAEAIYLKKRINRDIASELKKNFATAIEAEKSGNNIEAVTAYNKIIRIDPENKVALEAISKIAKNINIVQQLNSGIELFNSKKYRSAKRTFTAVLLVDKKNPVAIEYLKKINTTSLKETTLEDLQANKEIWDLYLSGLKFMRKDEYQKAIDAWEKVLKVFPNNINTINNIEQAKLRL